MPQLAGTGPPNSCIGSSGPCIGIVVVDAAGAADVVFPLAAAPVLDILYVVVVVVVVVVVFSVVVGADVAVGILFVVVPPALLVDTFSVLVAAVVVQRRKECQPQHR